MDCCPSKSNAQKMPIFGEPHFVRHRSYLSGVKSTSWRRATAIWEKYLEVLSVPNQLSSAFCWLGPASLYHTCIPHAKCFTQQEDTILPYIGYLPLLNPFSFPTGVQPHWGFRFLSGLHLENPKCGCLRFYPSLTKTIEEDYDLRLRWRS